MASITNSGISIEDTPVQLVKFRPNGRVATPLSPSPQGGESDITVSLYQSTSGTSFDPRCRHSLLLSSAETSRNPFFHQACVYSPEHEELFVTSNLLQSTTSSTLPIILISRVVLHRSDAGHVESVEWMKLRPPPNMAMPAGAAAYRGGVLYCSQGNLADGTGGLYYMPRGKPPEAVVTSFYGREFNSPHDVVAARDGSLWFTDPCHGFEKDFRPPPRLPCHLYRFSPDTGDIRVVADGLGRPTGLALSPDESTVYVTDTDAVRGNGDQSSSRAATVYAFDVIMRAGSPFLSNKRVFAFPLRGIPMGIKCDTNGYVYAGCADGLEIWSPGGTLQAVVEVPGGVTNFCFGRNNEMFLCAEQRLWRLQFGEGLQSAQSLIEVDRPQWFTWEEAHEVRP